MVKLQLSSELPEKYVAVRQYLERFGTGADASALYSWGPYEELIGREAATIGSMRGSRLNAVIDQASHFEHVNLTAGYLPAHIKGYIEPDHAVAMPLDLAIVMNGVVRATTTSFPRGPHKLAFEAMIPESAFREGQNHVALYSVHRDANGEVRLASVLTKEQERFRFLVEGEGRMALVSAEGVPIPVKAGAVRGWTERIKSQEGMVIFSGWAVDERNGKPAERILAFVGRKQMAAAIPNVDRRDLVKIHGPELAISGFEITIALELFAGAGEEEIRLFALSHDGIATEMKYNRESRAILRQALGN